MAQYNMTLRNLYRFLTAQDYPVPSRSVIRGKDKQGMTQTAFLQQICSSDFQQGPVGKMLWRSGEKRNRYFSALCNGVLTDKLFEQYTGELLENLSQQTIWNQSVRFADFLKAHDFQYDVFLRRIKATLLTFGESNPTEDSSDIRLSFSRMIKSAENIIGPERDKCALVAGLFLTWLFLLSVTGPFCYRLRRIICEYMDQIEQIDRYVSDKQNQGVSDSRLILVRKENQHSVSGHFYGYDDELLDLRDAVALGEKILVTGIGGIGKTELVRRVAIECVANGTVQEVLFVHYVGSMRLSLRRLSLGLQCDSKNEMNDMLASLAQTVGPNGLLVIDNMDTISEADQKWLDRIASASYPVLITSRLSSLNGFRVYRLNGITPLDGLHIIRDHLHRAITDDERLTALQLMQDPRFCHPQTAILIAGTVRNEHITFSGINQLLSSRKSMIPEFDEQRNTFFATLYGKLYNLNGLSAAEKEIVEFFTLLPYSGYSYEWLAENAPETDHLNTILETLINSGFLTRKSGCYFMHPLVSQSLTRKKIQQKKLERLLRRVCKNIIAEENSGNILLIHVRADVMESCYVLYSLADRILATTQSEMLSRALYLAYLACFNFDSLEDEYITHRDRLFACISTAQPDDEQVKRLRYAFDAAGMHMTSDEVILRFRQMKSNSRPYSAEDYYFMSWGSYLIENDQSDLSLEAEEMQDEVITCSESAEWRALARSFKAASLLNRGELDRCGVEAELLFDYLGRNECGILVKWLALQVVSSYFMFVSDESHFVSAVKMQKEILQDPQVPPFTQKTIEAEINEEEAGWYIKSGKPELAIEPMKKRIARGLLSEGKNNSYVHNMINLAQAFVKAGHFDEAEETYQAMLEEIDGELKKQIPAFTVLLLCNNYAVFLIQTGKAMEAVSMLERARENADPNSPAFGEIYRNFARAFELLQQKKKALRYWQQAEPFLSKMYGPDHERTMEASERIRMLTDG